MNNVYILLGSNIDKERNLPAAVEMFSHFELCELCKVSAVYETIPVGLRDQSTFLNAAVHIRTALTAVEIKDTLIHHVETRLKRVRTADKNAPRTIDADIMLFNDEVFEYNGRAIPDPDLLEFAHAAVPLAEIAPDLQHPITGQTLSEIAAALLQKAPSAVWKRPDIQLNLNPSNSIR